MSKSETIHKKETYKILGEFELQTDYLIQADLVLLKKKKISFHLADTKSWVNVKEDKEQYKYPDFARYL